MHFPAIIAAWVAALAASLRVAPAAGPSAGSSSAEPASRVRIIEPPAWSQPIAAHRKDLTESRPELRGFRVPLQGDESRWPVRAPGADAPAAVREAADHVAQHLASEGLLATTAKVIALLGPARFIEPDAQAIAQLKQSGLPVDLLRFFPEPEAMRQDVADEGLSVVRFIARQLETGLPLEQLRVRLADVPMRFERSSRELELMTESGETPVGMLRLQLTSGTDWAGEADGGSLDILRQLVADLPDTALIASIERRHLNELLASMSGWSLRPAQLTLIVEPFQVAQWAQDNGEAGIVRVPGATESAVRLATLVPRYASRGEDGSTFVPTESFLAESLQQLDQVVIQSPLIFQGGNALLVRNPVSGMRTLLLGEAEVYRNTALGLTPEQVVAAFGIEFGADRCSVLSAVSFHIDYEVSVRAHGDRLIAFVNEPRQATAMIVAAGADVLEKHAALSADQATEARRRLEQGEFAPALEIIAPALWARADRNQHFPLTVAQWFSTGPADSGVGNLQRILLAIDMMVAWSINAEQAASDGHSQAYLRSIQRLDADRAALHNRLASLGFHVVPVPSMGDGRRSINYLNGIHEPGRYLMPAYGGLFSRLDEAAAASFAAALSRSSMGDSSAVQVQIVPILCGESQRRAGGLHCAAAAYPCVGQALGETGAPSSTP